MDDYSAFTGRKFRITGRNWSPYSYTLSNGCVEGTNNKIKVIKRISYGYRNFYHLRSRIILSTAHNKVKNEAYRPLLFTEEDAIKKYEEEYQKQLEMQNKIA